VETAQLLVSELVTNSVVHAERHTADSIALDAEMRPRGLHVEVTDSGPGFEPKISTPTMYQHSGWGLYLLDQLADRWGVEPSDHDVSVWFELDLPA
jgi:anti-sigma regulatory factor (Ser/Thr protein kinase)